jgi:FAD/FMN-containing dehydrogenases
MDINIQLSKLLKANYVNKREEIEKYSSDASYITGNTPIGVAFPVNSDQVCKIIDICRKSGVSIVTRGGGSSLTGSSVPMEKSIVLSTVKMNKIIEVNTRDRYVLVQPGVILSDLNSALNINGFFYPPDPASSSIATVGGTIATNAGGLRAIAYGTTKEWVLGLEVVLGNGRKIAIGGKVLKRTIGYDLTSLFVGSEGTLGIITKAYLKIIPVPEATGMIVSFFSSMGNLSSSISDLKAKGVPLMIAEFLDGLALHSLSDAGLLDFPDTSKYMLMIVLQSTRESLKKHLNNAVKIINTSRPLSVKIVKGQERHGKVLRG